MSRLFKTPIALPASAAGYASLNLPHGTAPSAPTNGDVWTTTAGMYVRINGSTVGPLGTGGGGATPVAVPLTAAGTAVVGAGQARFYAESACTITSVRASVGTAPTGQSLIVDVNKNGTTIFSTQGNRPTIAASANTSGSVTNMDVTSLSAGDYITVDIDQIGSTVAGADLTVVVWLEV